MFPYLPHVMKFFYLSGLNLWRISVPAKIYVYAQPHEYLLVIIQWYKRSGSKIHTLQRFCLCMQRHLSQPLRSKTFRIDDLTTQPHIEKAHT